MSKLKEKIEQVVNAFKQNNDEAEKSIRTIIEGYCTNSSIFSKFQPQYKIDAFKEAVDAETKPISENVDKTNVLFNQKVKAIIAEEKGNILPKPKEKSADYAIRVSNALKYLEIEGEKLTDETAFEILKDFVDDYEQMKLFKQVIKRQMKTDILENAEGKSKFPRTFDNFNKIEKLINTFNEMEAIANVLFLKGTDKSEIYIFDNAKIELPLLSLPGYTELTNEDKILELAEFIDITINEANSIVKNKNYVNITE